MQVNQLSDRRHRGKQGARLRAQFVHNTASSGTIEKATGMALRGARGKFAGSDPGFLKTKEGIIFKVIYYL